MSFTIKSWEGNGDHCIMQAGQPDKVWMLRKAAHGMGHEYQCADQQRLRLDLCLVARKLGGVDNSAHLLPQQKFMPGNTKS